jgi:hypothetical protein
VRPLRRDVHRRRVRVPQRHRDVHQRLCQLDRERSGQLRRVRPCLHEPHAGLLGVDVHIQLRRSDPRSVRHDVHEHAGRFAELRSVRPCLHDDRDQREPRVHGGHVRIPVPNVVGIYAILQRGERVRGSVARRQQLRRLRQCLWPGDALLERPLRVRYDDGLQRLLQQPVYVRALREPEQHELRQGGRRVRDVPPRDRRVPPSGALRGRLVRCVPAGAEHHAMHDRTACDERPVRRPGQLPRGRLRKRLCQRSGSVQSAQLRGRRLRWFRRGRRHLHGRQWHLQPERSTLQWHGAVRLRRHVVFRVLRRDRALQPVERRDVRNGWCRLPSVHSVLFAVQHVLRRHLPRCRRGRVRRGFRLRTRGLLQRPLPRHPGHRGRGFLRFRGPHRVSSERGLLLHQFWRIGYGSRVWAGERVQHDDLRRAKRLPLGPGLLLLLQLRIAAYPAVLQPDCAGGRVLGLPRRGDLQQRQSRV